MKVFSQHPTMKILLRALLSVLILAPAAVVKAQVRVSDCASSPAYVAAGVTPGPMGASSRPVDLGNLVNFLYFFDGNSLTSRRNMQDAEGSFGDIAVNVDKAQDGGAADTYYVTSGGQNYEWAGTMFVDIPSSAAGSFAWDTLVSDALSYGNTASMEWDANTVVDGLTVDFHTAFNHLNSLTPDLGPYTSIADAFPDTYSGAIKDGTPLLDRKNDVAETIVIEVNGGASSNSFWFVDGDPSDIFVFLWRDSSGQYTDEVKFNGGGIMPSPTSDLKPGNLVHLAAVLNGAGGGDYPTWLPNGANDNDFDEPVYKKVGEEIGDFKKGGWFVGYWLTVGDLTSNGASADMSSSNFVGGWYTNNTSFSLTSSMSGVQKCPNIASFTSAATGTQGAG